MKKGVVLLITLFFITAISLLVLKNLDDTDIFLEKQNYIINNTQVLLAIKNTKNEIAKLLLKYKHEINKALDKDASKISVPINIEGLSIAFKLKKYSRVDINDMKEESSKIVSDLFSNNDIFDYIEFKEIYKEKLQGSNQIVKSTKQVDDIISAFILRSENKQIEKIRDKLGFLSEENLYELNIDTNYMGSQATSYYILDKEGKVKYFDISFK